MDVKEPTLKPKFRECDQVNYDLDLVRAAIGRGVRIIHNLSARVCTGYTSSMRAPAGDYQDCLNAFLKDAQLRAEYLGRH